MELKQHIVCLKRVLFFILFIQIIILTGCAGDDNQADNHDGGAAGGEPGIQQLISIDNLHIGDRVVDSSWEWGYRTNSNYTGSGELKPVTWVVVAKDHYDVPGGLSHVTLMADELVARYAFDDSTDRCRQMPDKGNSSWRDSGTTDAQHGLRPFLNSVFRGAMSESFRSSVIKTELVNANAITGEIYVTEDYVFVPSQTELGGSGRDITVTGDVLAFFDAGAELVDLRVASIDNEANPYWTRSSSAAFSYLVRFVHSDGKTYRYYANEDSFGVRPLVNVTAQLKVSHRPDESGVYQVVW